MSNEDDLDPATSFHFYRAPIGDLDPESNAGRRKRREWATKPWYRWMMFGIIPYRLERPNLPEYTPEVRYILGDGDYIEHDFYLIFGIPHEVTAPDGNWIPFKLWMIHYARLLRRAHTFPVPNAELFGGLYDRGDVLFWYEMKARIKKQRLMAFWVRTTSQRIFEVFHDEKKTDERRQQLIAFSLLGPQHDVGEMRHLREFIASTTVKNVFSEYRIDYLDRHPQTHNPLWPTIQAMLANPNIQDHIRAAYGRGELGERSTLSKRPWSEEDHAVRFIITLYNIASNTAAPGDVHEWRPAPLFSRVSAGDFTDRYWFGFSLLCLLIRSWQFNHWYPAENYEEVLVPAFYEGFEPHEFDFPAVEVGRLNLSSVGPWTFDQPTGISRSPRLMIGGYATPGELNLFDDEESEIEADV
ncbi:hypothetical protein AAE478_001022 [Parahypoxylon ruwenzoriense]